MNPIDEALNALGHYAGWKIVTFSGECVAVSITNLLHAIQTAGIHSLIEPVKIHHQELTVEHPSMEVVNGVFTFVK